MRKIGQASVAVALALLVSRAAFAQEQFVPQGDAPQWLKDRRYNEGAGVRTGDLELHPGIAGEVGYDSNWLLRSDKQNFDNSAPNAPPVPALEFRVTPSLYLATLGPQRREGDVAVQPPDVSFRFGVNATYREFVGLSSDPAVSQPTCATMGTCTQNEISKQRNIGGSADARVEIAPERPLGAALFASYARVIYPNAGTADPNLSFTRDDVTAGGEFITQPGGGTLDWHLGYQFHDSIFEETPGQGFNNTTHELFTRGRWKFRPRTALIYDATLRFLSYTKSDLALQQGLVDSTPVRARIGLNGLITDRFAALALVGWGAGFYDTSKLKAMPQYDSVIGQAELKWYLTASPGVAASSELTLALSTISLGYARDFTNSYLGNYFGSDRGYLRFDYFFGGRALVALTGGLGAVEYPQMYWLDPANLGKLRSNGFTDLRADATLFSEYRLTDSFGINATLRYTANFSSNSVPDIPTVPAGACTGPGCYDMTWTRFEGFLGVRYFL
jgi:hypothetical protein